MHRASLTRIHLNLTHPTVRRDLADYPHLHKTLMSLADDHLGPHPRQQAGLLFRLETDQRVPTLYVQTRQTPLTQRLPTGYGTADTRDLTPLLTHLQTGRHIRYRITASPTARIGNNPPPRHRDPRPGHRPTTLPRGAITPLHGPDALQWWHRRARQAGLTLTTTTHTPRPFRRPRGAPPGPHHHLVQFDGTAHISDPHALATALTDGIGRGRAYGAGLLSLAPA
ncbi:type I-E CRISPR-associated protein Cas6/Cse3/CasE [Streptomyces sp. NPDC056713]|uniref:type I-E CRISPR-associated protein Cas6/Cse3/CasE n=1 Tax=Streptomyces sp. NPDC056713 TaxID=3345921 RepID=UPI003675EEC4